MAACPPKVNIKLYMKYFYVIFTPCFLSGLDGLTRTEKDFIIPRTRK